MNKEQIAKELNESIENGEGRKGLIKMLEEMAVKQASQKAFDVINGLPKVNLTLMAYAAQTAPVLTTMVVHAKGVTEGERPVQDVINQMGEELINIFTKGITHIMTDPAFASGVEDTVKEIQEQIATGDLEVEDCGECPGCKRKAAREGADNKEAAETVNDDINSH